MCQCHVCRFSNMLGHNNKNNNNRRGRGILCLEEVEGEREEEQTRGRTEEDSNSVSLRNLGRTIVAGGSLISIVVGERSFQSQCVLLHHCRMKKVISTHSG